MPHSFAVLIVHRIGSQTQGFSSKMRENLEPEATIAESKFILKKYNDVLIQLQGS